MAEQSYPPDPSFSGIDFNPAFFPSTTSDYLEFPVAQGTETFGSIFVTDIDTPTPSVDFDLLSSQVGNINFGTSVPTTKTIKIGASTGTSIHCGSIDLQGTNINNAVASGSGTISLGPSQTTGTLYIGSHPTTGTRTTGPINIGTNSVDVTPITIGTTGQTTIVLNGTSVKATTKLTTPVLDCVTDAGTGNTSLSIGPSATSGNIVIGAALGVGDVSIASTQSTGGTVTIGSNNTATTLNGTNVTATTKLSTPAVDSSAAGTNMTIGSNLTTGTLTIGGTQTVDVALASAQTAGNLNIGNGARILSSAINIGTGSSTANVITMGSSSSSTVLNGTSVKATTKIITPTLDCVADTTAGTTALSIGPSVNNGNIVIGAALGVGDVSIASTQSTGGTVTIGSVNTATTISGTLTASGSVVLPSGGINGTTGILSGKNGYGQGGTVTISATTINSTYLYIITGTTSQTITLPTTATEYQIIIIRSIVNNVGIGATNTITAGGTVNIWPIGSNFATTYTLPIFGAIKLIYIGGTYYQIL